MGSVDIIALNCIPHGCGVYCRGLDLGPILKLSQAGANASTIGLLTLRADPCLRPFLFHLGLAVASGKHWLADISALSGEAVSMRSRQELLSS